VHNFFELACYQTDRQTVSTALHYPSRVGNNSGFGWPYYATRSYFKTPTGSNALSIEQLYYT